MKTIVVRHLAAGLLTGVLPFALNAADPPKVGEKAPDFTLKTLDDQAVRLSELTAKETVVLVVLRGWPGYQCPACDRQVQDYIAAASTFSDARSRVVFVYPGPADGLKAHAKEFLELKDEQWPKDFLYVLDPDYTMINAYHLRWNAPRETAYPSTFVIDQEGTVRFAKISRSHGDRTKAADVRERLKVVADK